MSIWRPSANIQVKALGIVRQDNKLLASEILDDTGNLNGIRPLGGTVEFGEAWQDALRREFKEELGTDITLGERFDVLENIYSHHGTTGHEVVFLCEVRLTDISLYQQDKIYFSEDNGLQCEAYWYDLKTIQAKGPELYPSGLLHKLNLSHSITH
jgi:hypothetical protein